MMTLLSAAINYLPTQWLTQHWRFLLEVIGILLAVFFTWQVAGWRLDAALSEQKQLCETARTNAFDAAAAHLQAEQAKANVVGAELEKELQKQRSTIHKLNGKIANEIQTQPVYRDCRPTFIGLHGLNEAVAAANRGR
ncbi:MAG: hypothetical protein K2Q12_07300 [Rickettsiales bacterium]|nr:hypothetical protein [Rickettsiales bacterium]